MLSKTTSGGMSTIIELILNRQTANSDDYSHEPLFPEWTSDDYLRPLKFNLKIKYLNKDDNALDYLQAQNKNPSMVFYADDYYYDNIVYGEYDEEKLKSDHALLL